MQRFLVGYVYLIFLFVCNVGLAFKRSSFLPFSRNSICKSNVCREEPKVVQHVMQGLVVALRECQHQFRNRRWNCTEKGNSLEKIMRYDYRESAFALAINAAGVTYSVTRACSLGELEYCGCDKFKYRGGENGASAEIKANQMQEKFRSQGVCDSNIKYGERISKLIFAGKKKAKVDARTALIRWNYQAGREALRKLMEKNCRCFGYSNMCTNKACWSVLPSSFSKVGARLKNRFDSATKVSYGNKGKSFHVAESGIKAPTPEDLLYTMDSPLFCNRDPEVGSLGTKGRYCNATSLGVDGCDLMCCKRGYETKTEKRKSYCRCNFVWCCVVKCDVCQSDRTMHTCL